ncbi:DNA repair protein RecO [Paenibacillus yanchengensis]|uniref:DNA repair protein RecO n=1 Tax=Paenibacillus yanchengensis TaxID=2035833 RepID=A0ABW4YKF1_9BACL
MLYRVEGIVIRSMDYGESHKIVTVLTKTHGKVGVLIRGAKKIRSKYGALAQPFTCGEFHFFRTTGLGTLNHGEILMSHHRLREELDLSANAAYIAELTDRILQDQEEGSGYVFEQLKACFAALQEDKDIDIVVQLYEMSMLRFAGYEPQLTKCIHCSAELLVDDVPKSFKLSATYGGILCQRCVHIDRYAIIISETAFKLLRLYTRMDLRRLGNIQVSDSMKQEMKTCMRKLIDTHLSVSLKSRLFLDQLDKLK